MDTVDFKKPDPALANGKNLTSVPTMNCVSPDEAESKLRDAGFEPNRVDGERSKCAKGKVYGTSPVGSLPKGSSVDYLVSAGKTDSDDDSNDRMPTVDTLTPWHATLPPAEIPPADLPALARWTT